MKANELRIGNYVQYKYGNIEVVSEIKTECLSLERELVQTKYEWVTGIPLTHEILEKCGFIKHRVLLYTYFELRPVTGGINIRFEDNEILLFIESDEGRDRLLHIKSLHSLQNLYFALTGEELKINL